MGASAAGGGGDNSVPVWVHRLRVHGPADSEAEQLSVRCPLQEARIRLEDCASCPSRGGVVRAEDGRVLALECHAPKVPVAERGGRLDPRTPVGRVMSKDVSAVTPTVSGADLVRVLVEKGVGGAPVVNAHGRALGVVSVTDLIREVYDEVEEPSDLGAPPHLEALTAQDLMTVPAVCVRVDTSVGAAAAVMAHERVHRLPVVSETGEVMGVLGTLDILRWLATESGYILPQDEPPRTR